MRIQRLSLYAHAISSIKQRAFDDALFKCCPNLLTASKVNLGLAVSGGADSLALAFLCRQFQKRVPDVCTKIRALIVDHQARPESRDEAEKVAGILSKIGINPQILTIQWPPDTKPAELPNFETVARRLRYRTMGRYCAQEGIEYLLTGHHYDDQVENILLRLSKGATGNGLQPMAANSPIPDCHDMHGVYESTGCMRMNDLKESSHNGDGAQLLDLNRVHFPEDLRVAYGGVRLCRPLLQFTKQDLLSTCEQYGLEYQTDATNFDPTMTPRNTIRFLFAQHKLPRALQPSRLMALAERKRSRYNSLDLLSQKLLEHTSILSFDLQNAILDVYLPSLAILPDHLSENEKISTCAIYLRYLVNLIRRKEGGFRLSDMEPIISRLFPQIRALNALHDSKFTAAGLVFEKSEKTRYSLRPDRWHIYPEPPRASIRLKNAIKIPALPPHTRTPFLTYGGRIWMRMVNFQGRAIPGCSVRSFTPSDADLKRHMNSVEYKRLMQSMPKAPVRLSLPVVIQTQAQDVEESRKTGQVLEHGLRDVSRRCYPSDDQFQEIPLATEEDQELSDRSKVKEKVVAFPTLGFAVPGLHVEVIYQKLDMDVLQLLLSRPRQHR